MALEERTVIHQIILNKNPEGTFRNAMVKEIKYIFDTQTNKYDRGIPLDPRKVTEAELQDMLTAEQTAIIAANTNLQNSLDEAQQTLSEMNQSLADLGAERNSLQEQLTNARQDGTNKAQAIAGHLNRITELEAEQERLRTIETAYNQLQAQPADLTRGQVILGLASVGITEQDVDNILAGIEDEQQRFTAQVLWKNQPTFRKTHPLIQQLSGALGLDAETLDTLWEQASQIQ